MQKLKLDELQRVNIEDFKTQEKLPVTVVLDNIRSMNNIGSIFRTCDGFSVEKIILCGISAQPPHREIEKTALGATKSVDWEYFEDTLEAIEILKKNQYRIIAIEQARESSYLNNFTPKTDHRYALILGNEVNGVQDKVMQNIDQCIEIPQFGTKHSFNVTISAGIVLWDFYLKLKLS